MDELLGAIDTLYALCCHSYGPSGEESLVFAPPDPPLITADGHSVLRAWRHRATCTNPFERVLLDAAEGVYREAGDGTTQFIVLMYSLLRSAAASIQNASGSRRTAMRVQLARAFTQLGKQWSSLREELVDAGVIMKQPARFERVSPNGGYAPTQSLLQQLDHLLTTALTGTLSASATDTVVKLVLQWVFASAVFNTDDTPLHSMYQHIQAYLRDAPVAVLHAHSAALNRSHIVPSDEFVLRKGLIPSQLASILAVGKPLRFVCLTGSLDVAQGTNHIVIDSDQHCDPWDHLHASTRRYVSALRDQHDVQLLLATDKINDEVAAACTLLGIACVQYAEADDVTALCIRAGIVPLSTVFDKVDEAKHIGVCMGGASVLRIAQTPYIHLRGIQATRTHTTTVVPQLVLNAPSKGVYKQYYNAVLKALRVVRSAVSAPDHTQDLCICRGAGSTEMQIARALDRDFQARRRTGSVDEAASLAIQATVAALTESVAQLRRNIMHTGGGSESQLSRHRQSTRSVLEEMSRWPSAPAEDECEACVLDTNRTISTLLGSIQVPTVVVADPRVLNVVHPWHRIDTIISTALQTVAMLLRIDTVVRVSSRLPKWQQESDEKIGDD